MSLMTYEDIIQVLIIGDDMIARLGLRTLLLVTGQVTIVGEVPMAPDLIGQVSALRPDVALLHGLVPGAELLTELRAVTRLAPVLVLSNDESPAAVERALRVGATGYLVNGQYDPDELVAAVLATAKGQPRLSPAAVRVLVDRLRSGRGHALPLERRHHLTVHLKLHPPAPADRPGQPRLACRLHDAPPHGSGLHRPAVTRRPATHHLKWP